MQHAAHADEHVYDDSKNVTEATNSPLIAQASGSGQRQPTQQRAISRTAGNGKATAPTKRCDGCDVVPARDATRERYHRYDPFIREAAALYRIPEALIRAIIRVESDYDPRVVSSKNARGLMQLLPHVAEEMGVQNIHDPRENILGGTRLLRILANRYDGDLVLTIAAYQAGMGNLKKYSDNIPPSQRTRRYVRRVLHFYYRN